MIHQFNIRDASYVTANLSPLDHEEVVDLAGDYHPAELVRQLIFPGGFGYVAYTTDGVPAMTFGVNVLTSRALSLWSLSTDRARFVLPRVTRFCLNTLTPWLEGEGYRYAECRVKQSNTMAARWVGMLGGKKVAELPGYGATDTFDLYVWTINGYEAVNGVKPNSGGTDVHH